MASADVARPIRARLAAFVIARRRRIFSQQWREINHCVMQAGYRHLRRYAATVANIPINIIKVRLSAAKEISIGIYQQARK